MYLQYVIYHDVRRIYTTKEWSLFCALGFKPTHSPTFSAHLSRRLKCAFPIKICPLSVVVVVFVVVVINFSHFHLLLQNHWANFNQTWHKASLSEGDLILFKWRARPFPRGANYEIVKIHWRNLKIFFSRTTESTSTKLSTKHPWVKGIQVCSNEGLRTFPRGDKYEIAKIYWQN